MSMKAIAVHQPWAQLLVLGAKKYETRSWKTSHRGLILIHAHRRLTPDAQSLAVLEPFRSALGEKFRFPSDLPLGAIVGAVHIDDCVPTESIYTPHHNPNQIGTFPIDDPIQEERFGDFRPGRWAWKLSNPVMFNTPIKIAGQQGVFEVRDEIVKPALLKYGIAA